MSVRPLGPFRLLVDGEVSGGRLTLYEGLLPVGGPPLHVHDFDEVILVLEGRLVVQLDESIDELDAGDFAWLAAGHAHTFANPGPAPVRALGLAVPSGIEHLFAERGEYLGSLEAGERPGQSEMAEIYERHASRVLGPPIQL
ncbi:MAG: cupin domain-containing protein [Acidimicrobiia bacterium]|nr:cupin domain-containing protein [Acidimicrobiia bacterium]